MFFKVEISILTRTLQLQQNIMENWNKTINCCLFHELDLSVSTKPLIEFMDEMVDLFLPLIAEGQISTTKVNTFRPKRSRFNKANLTNSKLAIQKGEVRTLLIGSLNNNKEMRFAFTIQNPVERPKTDFNNAWRRNSVGIWANVDLLTGSLNLDLCHKFMTRGWELLKGLYGFTDVFITHRTGSFTKSEQINACSNLKAKPFSFQVSQPTIDVAQKIPDSYWCNYLNRNHISAFQSVDKLATIVKDTLPRGIVNPLKDNGVALQISESPQYGDVFKWQEDHRKITQILLPLTLTTST